MSLQAVTKYIEPLPHSATGKDARETFSKNPTIRILPIADKDQQIIGLIERSTFLSALSQAFGREIYERRLVSLLMKPASLKLNINDTIDKAAIKISKPVEGLEIPCALVTNGINYCGIADASDIYRELSRCWNERAKELEIAKRQAEAARDAKANFLATMSHEIRTPLNGILGMANVLAISNMPANQKEMVATIANSGDVLLRIVNDILDMSKIEAGKLEIENAPSSLYNIFNSSISLFNERAVAKKIGFNIDIENLEIDNCLLDEQRFKQIVFNLLSNAIKFTNKGEVKVEAFNISENGRDYLITKVIDSGIGMSEEFLTRIFMPFEQADAKITREFGGTGLGLSICHSLVELMGGKIDVKSTIGEGSIFTLKIPITPCEAQEANIPNDDDAIEFGKLRILVAEDNQTNQLVLKTILSGFDMDLVFANNGQEAVEMYLQEDFDIILMDLQMPIMDGLSATSKIREIETSNNRKRTPILALSANAMSHHIEETKAADMDGHVAKPIRLEVLLNKIDEALTTYQECEIAA